MGLDREKIKKRFAEIRESLAEIGRLIAAGDEAFRSKKENMAALKYYLLQAIEAVGSIGIHVVVRKLNRGVSAFSECFELLEKEGLLEKDLADRLREMAKFRNRLIHRYWEIENTKVLDYAKQDLGDFTDFIKAVGKLL